MPATTTPQNQTPKKRKTAARSAGAELLDLETVVLEPFKLVMTAREGIKAGVAFGVAERLQLHLNQLASLLHTSAKTLQNYRQSRKKLNPAQSEQTLKLLALQLKGNDVFGAPDAFRRWLEKPAYGLDGQAPLSLLETSGGIDLVMEELERIAFGDLA
ncbi:type II RES/Xre toxin-antitoxin system antitoxin [Botryobacter ruber]|uniref:type II RES/Xre toxin-antitoxin system antitoxin n=1 Tax=Botryobacter ruber TaxID=2171629 RepID=UPI000E0C37CD|nr:antitoxin Xre/MbcA/ParS toxin-binding domain-containing protein [Botryobacter ruber]